MKRYFAAVTLGTIVALLIGTASFAQTLADVARETKKDAEKTAKPSKTYTNADLERFSGGAVSTVVDSGEYDTTAGGESPAAEAGESKLAGDEGQPGDTQQGGKGEDYWRQRAAEARKTKARAIERADLLQTKANILYSNWVAVDDPAQRDYLWVQYLQVQSEIEEARKETADTSQALTDLEDEARKDGALPGWLREE
ncbi:MAG: hypothetical protein AB1714_06375 [Acidobacteriota bacterium]